MALIIAGYVFNTYSNATLIVAGLATLIVAATIVVPYWAAQRMCARKAQRLAAARALPGLARADGCGRGREPNLRGGHSTRSSAVQRVASSAGPESEKFQR